MSKSNSWENAYLLLLFNNTNAANIGDATGLRGSSTAGSLYWSLHSADPGEAGSTQTTNEVTYGGYARVAAPRSSAGFIVTANIVNPAGVIDFPEVTSGTGSATFAGIGTASTGPGVLLYSGAISPSIGISTGVIPRIAADTALTED